MPVGLSRIAIPALNATVAPPLDTDAPVTLPCGQGPFIQIDGVSIPTALSGTLGDLVYLKPMRMVACPSTRGGVNLAAGAHTFAAANFFRSFEVASVSMQGAAPLTLSTPLARTATIQSWNAENRSIKVSAGQATYLAVAQNYNSGWTATLGGQTLKPIRLDGWQQGYVIPAGSAGVVKMVMTPDRIFRLLLALGAALLVLLLALALLPARRKVEEAASGPRAMPSRWVLFVGALVVLCLIAGPLALVAVPLLLIGRTWGRGTLDRDRVRRLDGRRCGRGLGSRRHRIDGRRRIQPPGPDRFGHCPGGGTVRVGSGGTIQRKEHGSDSHVAETLILPTLRHAPGDQRNGRTQKRNQQRAGSSHRRGHRARARVQDR